MNTATIIRVGYANVDVRLDDQTRLRSVPVAAPLEWNSLDKGDRVKIEYQGEQPYATSILDPRPAISTSDEIDVALAGQDTVLVVSQISTDLLFVDYLGSTAWPNDEGEIGFYGLLGIEVEASGNRLEFTHAVVTSGEDLHENYPEMGANEEISGIWTHTEKLQFGDGTVYLDAATLGTLTIEAATAIQIGAPLTAADYLILNPTTSIDVHKLIRSYQYEVRLVDWGISKAGFGDFRQLYADEMHVKAFVADVQRALAGGEIICKSVSSLYSDFNPSSSPYLEVFDIPGIAGYVFATDDIVRIRTVTEGAVDDVWLTVTESSDETGYQKYTFVVSSGAGSRVFKTDTAVLDYGSVAQPYGYVETQVSITDGSWTRVVDWTTNPWTPANHTMRVMLGDLDAFGFTDESGIYAKQSTYEYFVATGSRVELHGIDLKLYEGTEVTIALDPAVPSIALGNDIPTGFTTNTGIWMGKDGAETYKWRAGIPSDVGAWWDGAEFYITDDQGDKVFRVGSGLTWMDTALIGDMSGLHFRASDILLLGPHYHCKSEWKTTRADAGYDINGGYVTCAGRWAGTRAVEIRATSSPGNVDLNSKAGALDNRDQMSFRTVFSPGFDADGTPPNLLPRLWSADNGDNTDHIQVFYRETTDQWRLSVKTTNARTIDSDVQTFDAGDWLDIVCTINYLTDVYKIYINGIDVSIDGAQYNLTHPTSITRWKLGNIYTDAGDYEGDWSISEYAVYARELTQDEVTSIYRSPVPQVDLGATKEPGLYLVDSRFQIISSTSGTHLDLTSDYIYFGTDFTPDETSTGIFIGLDGTTPKLSLIGAGSYLKWDGTDLSIHITGDTGVSNMDLTKAGLIIDSQDGDQGIVWQDYSASNKTTAYMRVDSAGRLEIVSKSLGATYEQIIIRSQDSTTGERVPIYIDSQNYQVGIFRTSPAACLDIKATNTSQTGVKIDVTSGQDYFLLKGTDIGSGGTLKDWDKYAYTIAIAGPLSGTETNLGILCVVI
jgi:hypothetical protein